MLDFILAKIKATVSKTGRCLIGNEKSVHKVLRILARRFKPDPISEMMLVENKWAILRESSPKSMSMALERWCDEWTRIFCKGRRLGMEKFKDNDPLLILDFTCAVKRTDPDYADVLICGMLYGDGNEPTFFDVVRDYRRYLEREEAYYSRFQSELSDSSEYNTYDSTRALNDGHANGQESRRQRNQQRNRCLCGNFHDKEKCYYLNEKARPDWWKPKEKIMKKINEEVKKDPKLQELVRKYKKRNETSNINSPSTTRNNSNQGNHSDNVDDEDDEPVLPILPAFKTSSLAIYPENCDFSPPAEQLHPRLIRHELRLQ